MARQLSTANTRLVITTDASQDPEALSHEYRVKNGDLAESPKLTPDASPNFNQTVNAMWTGAVSAIETAEGI